MHIEGKTHRLETNLPYANNRSHWVLLGTGLAIGLCFMYFGVTRPLANQFSLVKLQLHQVEENMVRLVGERDRVWETNNLLSSLKSQQGKIDSARNALDSIQQLREQVEDESRRAIEAAGVLDSLVALQNTIIEQREITKPATMALSDVVALQSRVIDTQAATHTAAKALDQLSEVNRIVDQQTSDTETTIKNLRQLSEVNTRLHSIVGEMDAAEQGLCRFVELKNDIVSESQDIATARKATDDLLALKDGIVAGTANLKSSQENAERLIDLKDKLQDVELDIATADRNLGSLFTLESKLRNRTDVTEAMQTLELASDLSGEIHAQLQSLGNMRRDLIEVLLLENTVARALRILEPLTALGNLRRLSDAEVREAARVILDQRSTRVSRSPHPVPTDGIVLPNALGLFQNLEDHFTHGLVPLPPADED